MTLGGPVMHVLPQSLVRASVCPFSLCLQTSRACGGLSCKQGFHTYVCDLIWLFSLISLLQVYLIIRPAERNVKVEESFFLLHNGYQQPKREASEETVTGGI